MGQLASTTYYPFDDRIRRQHIEPFDCPCLPATVGLRLRIHPKYWWPHNCRRSNPEGLDSLWPYPEGPKPHPGEFRLFTYLPAELRIQIWDHIFDEPCLWQYASPPSRAGAEDVLVPIGPAPSQAGASCVEAREIMKRRYISVRQMYRKGTIWMDPERTVIDLGRADMQRFVDGMKQTDMAKLTHVVHVDRQRSGHPTLRSTFEEHMPNIQTLLIELSTQGGPRELATPDCTVRAGLLVYLAMSNEISMIETPQPYSTVKNVLRFGLISSVNSLPTLGANQMRREMKLKWLVSSPAMNVLGLFSPAGERKLKLRQRGLMLHMAMLQRLIGHDPSVQTPQSITTLFSTLNQTLDSG